MCGLFGVVNREVSRFDREKLIKVFSQGLYCDALRGRHGTGVLGVGADGISSVYKRALAAADFLELKPALKIIDDTDNIFLLGHNRYATQGGHTSDNAHPFSHDHIHLFHNGTLDFYKSLNPGKTFTVDSDAIAHYLCNSLNYTKALEELEGAYSLVWYDEAEETLNFARNKERPMFFGLVKDSASFIYGSEEEMISWLASRNGVVLDKIISTAIGKLIKVNLDPKNKTEVSLFTPKEKSYETYYNYGKYNGKSNNINYSSSKEVTTISKMGKYDGLKGKRIVVEAIEWKPYTGTTSHAQYGQFHCLYDNDLRVNVSSINKKDIDKYSKQLLVVEITSVSEQNLAYAKLISIAIDTDLDDEAKENTELSFNNSVLGPQGVMISIESFFKRVSHGCAHCNSTIELSDAPNLLWEWNGEVICPQCKPLFIQ